MIAQENFAKKLWGKKHELANIGTQMEEKIES